MTVGESLGSLSQATSFDVGSVSVSRGVNRAGTGSTSVTVLGAGLGLVCFTGMVRSGLTGCEGTEWESETSVRCLTSLGARGTRGVTFTAGDQGGSLTQVISFDSPGVSASRRSNAAGKGSALLTVHGAGLGYAVLTGIMSAGQTGCEGTEWESETSVRCLVGHGARGTRRMVMTAGRLWRSMSEGYSVEAASMSVMRRGNGGCTGSASVTVHGLSLGRVGLTAQGRIRQTDCEGSGWESETSVRCLVGHGARGTRRVVMSAGERGGSGSAMYSVDVVRMSVTWGSNRAGTGSATVMVYGAGLEVVRFTGMGRSGQTGCEGTEWESATALRCRLGHGTWGTRRIVMTAGGRVGSMSEAYSVNTGILSATRCVNRAGTWSASVTVHGSSMGLVAVSAHGRVGHTGCEGTGWESETSVRCLVGHATFACSLRFAVSVPSRLGSQSEVFSYDTAVLRSLGGVSNVPPTDVAKTLYISGFLPNQQKASSVSFRLGSSQCEASEWISGSALLCKFVRGSPGSVLSVVLSAHGVAAGTVSNAFTIDVPWILSVKNLYTSDAFERKGMFVDLSGQNFGMFDATLKVGLGNLILQDSILGCKSTLWTSDSSISCQIFPKWEPVAKINEIVEAAPGSLVCNACDPPYTTIKCSPVSTGYCALCQPCNPGKYRFGCMPGGVSEGFCRSCQTLPEAPNGQRTFKTIVGTPLSKCTPCTICGGVNQDGRQFEVNACTETKDTVCQNCSSCGAGSVRVGCAGSYAGFCSTSIGDVTATSNINLKNSSEKLSGSTLSLIEDVELHLMGEHSDIKATLEAGSRFICATLIPSELVITISKIVLSSSQEAGLNKIESGLLVLSSPILLTPEELEFSPELKLAMPVKVVDGMALGNSATHVAELFRWESTSGLWTQQPGLVLDFERGMGYASLRKMGVHVAVRVQKKIPVSSAPYKVVLVLGLPISKGEFDTAKQAFFITSMASAAQVPIQSVEITSIKDAQRRASGIEIGVAVGAANAQSAASIAGNLSPERINSQLAQAGLPGATILQVPAVQNSAEPQAETWVPVQVPPKNTDGLGATYSKAVTIVVFVVFVFCSITCIALLRWYKRPQSSRKQTRVPEGPSATAEAGLELGGRSFNSVTFGVFPGACFPGCL